MGKLKYNMNLNINFEENLKRKYNIDDYYTKEEIDDVIVDTIKRAFSKYKDNIILINKLDSEMIVEE